MSFVVFSGMLLENGCLFHRKVDPSLIVQPLVTRSVILKQRTRCIYILNWEVFFKNNGMTSGKRIGTYISSFNICQHFKNRHKKRRKTFERIDRTKEREKTDIKAATCNPFERKFNNPFERDNPSSVCQALRPLPPALHREVEV